jgi:RNA-binding protein 25
LKHSINWSLIEENNVVDLYLRPFVIKKTQEYLGEEVESLTTFIVTQLKARCSPNDLLDELTTILESDSEMFVLKLWRMLVYYSLKCEMEV